MRTVLSAIVVLCCVGGAVGAEVRTSKSGGVSIDIPSAWKVEIKGDLMVGASADDAVGLAFWVVDKSDVKEVLKALDKQVEKMVSKAKWEKPVDITINGLKGIVIDGKGLIKGKQAELSVAIFGPTPTKKGIVILGGVEKSKLDVHKAELKDIFASLKPVK